MSEENVRFEAEDLMDQIKNEFSRILYIISSQNTDSEKKNKIEEETRNLYGYLHNIKRYIRNYIRDAYDEEIIGVTSLINVDINNTIELIQDLIGINHDIMDANREDDRGLAHSRISAFCNTAIDMISMSPTREVYNMRLHRRTRKPARSSKKGSRKASRRRPMRKGRN